MSANARWSLTLGVCALVPALVWCSPFSGDSSDEEPRVEAGPPPPSNDAAESGSATPADAGGEADSAVAGPNLLTNGTFEEGCKEWGGFQGTVSPVSNGRSGMACRICPSGSPPDGFSINTTAVTPPAPPPQPGAYTGEVWVRGDALASNDGVFLAIRTRNQDMELDTVESPSKVLSLEWEKLSLSRRVTPEARTLELYVYALPQDPSNEVCFIVDDATLARVGP